MANGTLACRIFSTLGIPIVLTLPSSSGQAAIPSTLDDNATTVGHNNNNMCDNLLCRGALNDDAIMHTELVAMDNSNNSRTNSGTFSMVAVLLMARLLYVMKPCDIRRLTDKV